MADSGKPSQAFSALQDVVLCCAEPVNGIAAFKAAEIYTTEIANNRGDEQMLQFAADMLRVAIQCRTTAYLTPRERTLRFCRNDSQKTSDRRGRRMVTRLVPAPLGRN
jgi:hypothetical protein